jgi:hypothetical protein
MWSSAFTDIGFNNRLFLVPGKGKRKYPMPRQIPESLRRKIVQSLSELVILVNPDLEMGITDGARKTFEDWYLNLDQSPDQSIHRKRIDTIALRLLPLLAINDKKTQIDNDTVEKSIAIANWQLEVRKELDPIDADNAIAKMEEKIRRQLRKRPMRKRELRQNCNVKKAGLWMFEKALENLRNAEEVSFDKNTGEFTYTNGEA